VRRYFFDLENHVPDVDDEVLVGFQAGDPRLPYVLGGLWNGRDAPPEPMDRSGKNEKKPSILKNLQALKEQAAQTAQNTPAPQRKKAEVSL
jgi:uncharacterized protein involved in type VI secretion and phage assembly